MNIDENIQHRRGNTNSNDQDRGQQSSSIPILPPSVASSIGNYVIKDEFLFNEKFRA